MLTPLPCPQANVAPLREIPPWASDFSSRKRKSVGINHHNHPTPPNYLALWIALPEPVLWSLSVGIAGEFVKVNHWEIDSDKGACNNQHINLGRLSLYLQHPSYYPMGWLCLCAEPSQWHTQTRKLWQGADLLDSEPHMRIFASPTAQFPHAQARRWVIAPFAVENVFWPHLTRGTGENIWKQCSSQEASGPSWLHPEQSQFQAWSFQCYT